MCYVVTINIASQDFPVGSVLCAYVHRFFFMGSDLGAAVPTMSGGCYLQIPYYSNYGYEMNKSSVVATLTSKAIADFMDYALGNGTTMPRVPGMAPNDEGLYAVQKPLIGEYYRPTSASTSTSMNRYYGVLSSYYATCANTMAQMLDGRLIPAGGDQYIYCQTVGNSINNNMGSGTIFLIPDFNSIV